MANIFSKIILFVLLQLVYFINSSAITNFTINGITYETNTTTNTLMEDGTCSVTNISTTLKSVNIPAIVSFNKKNYQVVKIRNAAFRNTVLESISFPSSIKEICHDSFYGCKALKSISFSEGLEIIGEYAFGNCSNLTSIYLPSSVKKIDLIAFAHCTKLTSIEVSPENTVYDSRNNCNGIIKTDENKIISACSTTILPPTIKIIGRQAYCGSSIESINIPEGVEIIEELAFESSSNLRNISLPMTLTSIGNKAFKGCDLSSIYIPQNVNKIGDDIFLYCSNLSKIIVSKDNICYDSRDNSNAIIDKSSNELLVGCYKTIIPNTILYIGKNAFNGLTQNGTNNSRLTCITIPEGVERIGTYAFAYNDMQSINIPNTTKEIDHFAFFGCIYEA